MKPNSILVLLLLVLNFIYVIEGKKILLGLIGLHALRKAHGLQRMHHLVTYYLPLRYAADAWKSYGKVAATTPQLPSYLSVGHKSDHKIGNTVKLTAEQSYELDSWLKHYFPEDIGANGLYY